MKKTIAVILALCLCASVTACGAAPAEVNEAKAAPAPAVTEKAAPVETENIPQTAEPETATPIADEEPEEFTVIGRWKLDMDRIDTNAFFAAFGSSAHEGAQMNILEDYRMNFYIGVTGGYGHYMPIEGGFVCSVTTYNEGAAADYIIQPDAANRLIYMNIDGVDLFWVKDENAREDMVNELMEKLLYISQNVQLGTSGSQLRAVQAAAALMDWASYAPMTKEGVYETVGNYMQVLENRGEGAEEFKMQISAVEDAYNLLHTNDRDSLLESAGVQCLGYPWDNPIPVAEDIFAAAFWTDNSLLNR